MFRFLHRALYRVGVANGVVNANSQVATLTPPGDLAPCSPVTDVYNPNTPIVNAPTTTNAPEEWVFFGLEANGHPPGCTNGCAIGLVDMPWKASTSYTVGQEILVRRTNNNTTYINVAIKSGTSGTASPTWPNPNGTQTTDGTVTWLNQGATTVTTLGGWVRNTRYAARARFLDTNNNVEVAVGGGTSGGTEPNWPTIAGETTTDGTVTWYNAGVWPITSLSSAGGITGIIYDNTVASGTEAGASQVYFSTLANQTCVTSGGTGGCAIQASQSALK